MRSQSYDLPTAVTFLMAGLGIGSLLAILFVPRSRRLELARSLSPSVTHRACAQNSAL
jgi:hypothetical protein